MEPRERALSLSAADAASLRAEREARRAAAFVAAFVGVPAALAAGATIVLVAVTSLVLLAPVVAAVLTWVAWRYGRPIPPKPDA
ncbi:MAG TPA: hypothetical protein VFL83_21220 [Anaeromyxobacter sp.]|nr:hypothetical protein [Anaeromyxobacter sp.]